MATETPSVEQAVRVILEKNFDADSKVCFLTLLKIIDNVLQKPGNEKVRSLRTGNATIKSKILDNHGHHLLMACGFVHEPADPKWQKEERLVLPVQVENTQVLVKARHTLARIAVLELGLQSADIPKYKAPPAAVKMAQTTNSSSTAAGFDVYSGSRFDGQSAALGADLGAPKNWKSKTEQELQALQQREQKLQRELQQKGLKPQFSAAPTMDRQWAVFLPGQKSPPTLETNASTTASSSTKGDASLLASHFKQQHAKRVAADSRGFTTKAMRDLEKLKKTKVYSHTQLAIHFSDGISAKANFSTTEKVQAVMESLVRDVLFSTETLPLPSFEIYQTPPRRVLDKSQTLQSLGLVPAAKVYVSWKKALPTNISGLSKGWYIQQHLLQGPAAAAATKASMSASGPALPTSVPVLQSQSTQSTASGAKPAETTKRKKTRAEKEAAMMKRMLGKR